MHSQAQELQQLNVCFGCVILRHLDYNHLNDRHILWDNNIDGKILRVCD